MDKATGGWISGFIGVLIFSGSLPATRLAVLQFDPIFLTVARATIAGMLALALLLLMKQKRPSGRDLAALAVVAGGVVLGFPLVLSLPVMLVVALYCRPPSFDGIAAPAWLGLGYVSLFSMLIGFVFWYRGLALGGIAAVGQLQLLQPIFGLALAAWLLGEPVSWTMLVVTLAVIACVAGARRFAR